MGRWEEKAKILYKGTSWERAACAAGKAMDNRLSQEATGPYGHHSEDAGAFDMFQYLAFFDYEVLVRRGLSDRIAASLS